VRSYTQALQEPSNTELRIDLQKLEDQLQVVDLVIAREHAKIEVRLRVLKLERRYLLIDVPLVVQSKSQQRGAGAVRTVVARTVEVRGARDETQNGSGVQAGLLEPSHLARARDFESVDRPRRAKQHEVQAVHRSVRPKDVNAAILMFYFAEHKYNLTLANLSVSLICHGQEIALASVTQFLLSLETRPAASAFKLSARAENFLLEGLGADNELVPLIQADSLSSGKE
jgi:hypothetical protein